MRRTIATSLIAVLCSGHVSAQNASVPTDFAAQLRELATTNQPTGVNGADLLAKIAPQAHTLELWMAERDYYFEHAWDPGDADADAHQREVATIRGVLATARETGLLDDLARLAATDYLLPPDFGVWTDEARGTFLSPTRRIARIEAARFALAGVDGDQAEALTALQEMLWLSRRTSALAFAIPRLNGAGIEKMALDRVRDAVLQGQVDGPFAEALLHAILTAPPIPNFDTTLRAEDLVQRHRLAGAVNADGVLMPERLPTLMGQPALQPREPLDAIYGEKPPSLDQLLAWDAKWLECLGSVGGAPAVERATLEAECLQAAKSMDPLDPTGTIRAVMRVSFAGLATVATAADALTLEQAGTSTMLALEIYRAQHGALPQSLAELTPAVLPEPLMDPFSRQALLYHPDPASPLGYVLYSAGFDGVDQGGRRWPEDRPAYRVLSPDAMGFDYIFVGR